MAGIISLARQCRSMSALRIFTEPHLPQKMRIKGLMQVSTLHILRRLPEQEQLTADYQ